MSCYIEYLNINSENLPLPISYEIELEDVEADSSGETEAGTMQRDVVRAGVVTISCEFQVTSKWLSKLSSFKKQARLNVKYFDTESLELKQTYMYVESFKVSLVKDTSYKGLWNVSLTLKEF